ncbi:MAG TPA: formate dehydrogenase accessory sulfurtransferase FdhD [Thermoanaerobaculia bacterium]|nr:formate dehydrogenase accessory sulfurtransferase FdhD [Thermoanaerobaculia bacterium]
MSQSTRIVPVTRVGGALSGSDQDALAVEEPLEIQVAAAAGRRRTVSITMRTPGNDLELAAGFLFTEALLRHSREILSFELCGRNPTDGSLQNVMRLTLAEGVNMDDARLDRNFYTTSSCGVCGKTSIDALQAVSMFDLASDTIRINADVVKALPARLRASQTTFATTGGLHAAGLFAGGGELLALYEDVGRHNALDKVIGRRFLDDALPLAGTIVMLSGRASFELVQKGVMAGVPIMAAIGAPSTLAVELAESAGMTLIGFVRDERFNIYCGKSRIEN